MIKILNHSIYLKWTKGVEKMVGGSWVQAAHMWLTWQSINIMAAIDSDGSSGYPLLCGQVASHCCGYGAGLQISGQIKYGWLKLYGNLDSWWRSLGEGAMVVGEDGEGREGGQGGRAGQPHNSDNLEEFIMFSAFHLMLLSL